MPFFNMFSSNDLFSHLLDEITPFKLTISLVIKSNEYFLVFVLTLLVIP